MSKIGHNQPPSEIEGVNEATKSISDWLTEHPVIQNEEDARAGKLLVDRASGSLKDLEAERKKKVAPLNEQVKNINNEYAIPRDSLTNTKDILIKRLTDYAKEERRRREEEAEIKRRALEEAEARARAAEESARLATEDASMGVTVDTVDAANREREACAEYDRALREAARAERGTKVKIGGGFNRALGLRSKETLILVDWRAAINHMGISEDIIEAILKDARSFRRERGHLPEGIKVTIEESL